MFVYPTPQGDDVPKADPSKRVTGKRVYQIWKGSNIFVFGGRLIFGPDAHSLVVTIFLIVAPVVAFCIYVARPLMHEFAHHAGIAIMVVAAWLTFDILVLLLLTSARDPGIIPRSTHPPEPEEDCDSADSPSTWSGQTPRLRLPRTKDVIVNGVSVKIKYCDTCMLYRPPRCSHCSICNNCVERFDHHCPWVGQCIGRRNYPFFVMFILSATVLCVYVFAMSALHINKSMEVHSYTVWRALGKSPASVVLMVYTFIAVWFVGGLTLFHLYLISTNQTTYENFRYRYDNKVNPYDCGIAHNFREIFWTRIPPSKNNFRGMVQHDFSSTTTNAQSVEFGNVLVSNSRKACDTEVDIYGWTMADENSLEFDARKGHCSGIEMKTGYEEHDLPLESCDATGGTHHTLSGLECESGGLEIAPDAFALSAKNSPVSDARKGHFSGMEMKTGYEGHALPLEGCDATGGMHHKLSGLECESGSLEIAPDAFALSAENSPVFDARKSHFTGMEMKTGYEGHALQLEGCDAMCGTHHKLSGLECESVSLEIAPDTFALAAGVGPEGSCTLETTPHKQTG